MTLTAPLTITVCSLKGGVGTTTVAVHLAAALAAGRPTGTVALQFTEDAPYGASLWARNGLLPVPVGPRVLPADLASPRIQVIDGGRPATLDALRRQAESTDILLIPVTAAALDLMLLRSVAHALGGLAHWACVMNDTQPPRPYLHDTREEWLAELGIPVLTASVRYEELMEEAGAVGLLVTALHEFTPDDGFGVWGDVLDVAREVLARHHARPDALPGAAAALGAGP